MAVALEQPDDLPWIDARLHRIEQAFGSAFWTGKEFRSRDYVGQTDDRANALAVVAGLTHPDQYPALLEVFRNHAHASPYMEKYVLEALCLMGEPVVAQQRMKQPTKK